MKLSNQLTSKELSIRLRELGVPQDSLWYWYPIPKVTPNSGGKLKSVGWKILPANSNTTYGSKVRVSAYATSELGEMIIKNFPYHPMSIITTNTDHGMIDSTIRFQRYYGGRVPRVRAKINLSLSQFSIDIFDSYPTTEAEARGEMLAYLIKEGIVKVEDL